MQEELVPQSAPLVRGGRLPTRQTRLNVANVSWAHTEAFQKDHAVKNAMLAGMPACSAGRHALIVSEEHSHPLMGLLRARFVRRELSRPLPAPHFVKIVPKEHLILPNLSLNVFFARRVVLGTTQDCWKIVLPAHPESFSLFRARQSAKIAQPVPLRPTAVVSCAILAAQAPTMTKMGLPSAKFALLALIKSLLDKQTATSAKRVDSSMQLAEQNVNFATKERRKILPEVLLAISVRLESFKSVRASRCASIVILGLSRIGLVKLYVSRASLDLIQMQLQRLTAYPVRSVVLKYLFRKPHVLIAQSARKQLNLV